MKKLCYVPFMEYPYMRQGKKTKDYGTYLQTKNLEKPYFPPPTLQTEDLETFDDVEDGARYHRCHQ